MTQFNSLNVKLSHSKLNELKSALKNEIEAVLRLTSNMTDKPNGETNFWHKLLLNIIQVANLCNMHFRPKLLHWNKRVYCTPIDRALKMWFNEGSGNLLRPTIPALWIFWKINYAVSWTK